MLRQIETKNPKIVGTPKTEYILNLRYLQGPDEETSLFIMKIF